MLKGLGVSKGLCMARVLKYEVKEIKWDHERKSSADERKLFEDALNKVYEETRLLQEKARKEAGDEAADIFDAHCSIIMDEGFTRPVLESIEQGNLAAESVERVLSEFIQIFETMEDAYLSQRSMDIKDIKERIIRKILRIEVPDLSKLQIPVIVVGYDLLPSVTAGMDMEHIAGLLMERGGDTSHTAILARTMEIPAIVGIPGLMDTVSDGELIAFDGETGEIFRSLTQEQLTRFEEKKKQEEQREKALIQLCKQPAITRDGVKVEVYGNIGSPDDVKKVVEKGGGGIGLFRSEFLYLSNVNNLPGEEVQFAAYRNVLEKMKGKVVIVRTLDIGGDKEVPALHMKKEENPFLGLRALRLCKEREDMFRTQLKALLRASKYGTLHIMFPMVSSLEELRWAKEVLKSCREELKQKGIAYQSKIPVGIMIEIPSAALAADVFARECDFFSIGTNDLVQYTLAVDRGNEAVASLYQTCHPSILRLIAHVIEKAHEAGIPCGMCGEAAADKRLIPFFLGLGLDEFSMSASSILEVKELIGNLDGEECRELKDKVLQAATAEEAKAILDGNVK